MHYIGKEQMHTYCNPLFSIFHSKFYLKYKFYQNVKNRSKKEVNQIIVLSKFKNLSYF